MPVSLKQKIWVDLDNSPHVPFFTPIVRELEKRGYITQLTARDCFQVCGLADLHGLSYHRLGKHYGKNKAIKVAGTLYRSLQLLILLSRSKVSLAVSHGSRSQVIAAKLLGIRSVVVADYEHVKGLALIRPDVLIVPEVVASSVVNRFFSQIRTYPGIKEDVYVPEFSPDGQILQDLGINEEWILVTIRPPATEAHYHNPESEILFTKVVEFLGSQDGIHMVLLPRNEKKQGDFIKSRWARWYDEGKIIIPEKVVNGLNLIWHSDVVVSGGGTMNREAAALGVPVYSIFRGKLGAVDKYLEQTGRLTMLSSPDDVNRKMCITKRPKGRGIDHQERLALSRIVDVIEEESKII